MSDHPELSGPDFLEQLADRQEANGFDIEADNLRQRAREWSRDKQAIDQGRPEPRTFPAGAKAFNAHLVEVDFERNRLVFQPNSERYLVGAGLYHLIPAAA